jgi:hypothetical protein
VTEPLATADGAKASGPWPRHLLRAATLFWVLGLYPIVPPDWFFWRLALYGVASLIAGATLESIRGVAMAVGEMALITALAYALAYPLEAAWPGSAPWTTVTENETEAVGIFVFASSAALVLGAFAISAMIRRFKK